MKKDGCGAILEQQQPPNKDLVKLSIYLCDRGDRTLPPKNSIQVSMCSVNALLFLSSVGPPTHPPPVTAQRRTQ